MSRIELVREKFPELLDVALKVEDVSGNNKYLLWIAEQLSKGHNTTDIFQTLKYFHTNIDKFKIKDIGKYQDLKELEDLVKDFGISNRKAKISEKEGAEKIYEDDKLMVVRTDTKQAMIFYGANTRWCTTMKDHAYFEDYVARGNEFYVIIRKDKKALKFAKYAIVRNGLLKFSIYDEKDDVDRPFSDEEESNLINAIKAIISDKPQKNFIKQIIDGKVNRVEAAEWLKTQANSTIEFIERRRPELRFICKSADEIIKILSNKFTRLPIKNFGEDKIIEIAKRLVELPDKNTEVKLLVLGSIKDKFIFSSDKDPNVRSKAIEGITSKQAEKFINDKSIVVFKTAARLVSAKFLLDYIDSSKSSKRKKAANEIILERISQEKVSKFVLNQSIDVLMTLLD